MYEIEQLVKNGDIRTGENNDSNLWKTLLINGNSYFPKTISVRYENGENEWFSFEADILLKHIDFKRHQDTTGIKYPFQYTSKNNKRFELNGILKGQTLYLKRKAKFMKDYRLKDRGVQ